MLPNFLVIGPGKSASTFIYECLREHPEVCLAKNIKETLFFDKNYQKGIEWYKKFFNHCVSYPAIGEVSQTYIVSDKAPERIFKHIPNVKLICCLRNPIDRIYLSYLWMVRNGMVTGTFEETLEKCPDMITNNFYYDQLRRYLNYFPKENILILLYDDLQKDPPTFIKSIYNFLGVNSEFSPSVIGKEVLPDSKPRNKYICKLAKTIALGLRKFELYSLLNYVTTSQTIFRLLFKPYGKDLPSMSEETRKRLLNIFEEQIKMLSKLIDRDLSYWR